MRAFVLDNVRMWFDEYRVDGLRLDAVHAIADDSPRHIVAELAALAHAQDRLVIAESDLGDVAVISSPPAGWGCDAQWSDDFHHALHAVVTGERSGYYEDFGAVAQLATAVARGLRLPGATFAASRARLRHAVTRAAGRALRRLRAEPRSDRQPRRR